MATSMICYPNRADEALLSDPTGAWLPALPVAMLQQSDFAHVARTNGLQANVDEGGQPFNARIDVNFQRLRNVMAMAMCNHNFSLSATCRLVLWTDYTMSAAIYDSGYQPVWPPYYDTLDCRWEDANWWSGQIDSDLLGTVPAICLQMVINPSGLFEALGTQYASIFIYDPLGGLLFTPQANGQLLISPAGYLQAGRLYMASDWTPVNNFSYGAGLTWSDPTVVDTAQSGARLYDLRPKFRKFSGSLDFMSLAEGVNQGLGMAQNRGISGDVLFIKDPGNKLLLQQTSFVGCLSTPDKVLKFASCLFTSMQIDIQELV